MLPAASGTPRRLTRQWRCRRNGSEGVQCVCRIGYDEPCTCGESLREHQFGIRLEHHATRGPRNARQRICGLGFMGNVALKSSAEATGGLRAEIVVARIHHRIRNDRAMTPGDRRHCMTYCRITSPQSSRHLSASDAPGQRFSPDTGMRKQPQPRPQEPVITKTDG